MKKRSLIFFLLMALGAPWTAQAQFSGGNGTSSNPYQIANATDWNTLATNVAAGTTEFVYQNVYFCLTNDISVSTMVGTMEGIGNATATRKFGGNFDGQGHTLTFNCTTSENECAPFRVAGYGTFKNLRIEGTIQTSGQFAAGLVSNIRGNSSSSSDGSGCTFRNCISNITIIGTNSNSSFDGTYGGLVSHTEDGKNYYYGCAFTGTFSGNGKSWGGLIGWTANWGSGRNGYLYDCLFAPTSISGINNPSDSRTLSRNSPATIENCYYTEALGTTQGTNAYKVTLAANPAAGGTVDGGTPTTDYGFVKAYSNGLLFNGVYYANGSVSLNATANNDYTFSQWNDNNTSNPRTVNVSGDANYTATFTQGGGGGGSDGTLTVYDGTATSQKVPMYVYYFDDYTRSQFVIPAADLTDMAGGTINSIKFYTKSDNIPYTTVADFDIYVKEVNYTTITALEAKSSATIVYQGKGNFVTEGSGGSITITFSTPFTYNGGNLLIGCDNTTDAGYKNINFYGQEVTGASTGASNGSSLDQVSFSQQNFIPKTTFYYTLDAPKPLPYTYGFENNDLTGEGWTMVNCHESTGINSSANMNGSYGFQFRYNTTPPQYLVSPQLTGTTDGVDVEFYYKNSSSTYPETFSVGYSTNSSDPTSFTYGEEITISDGNWTKYEGSFPAGTKYVAIKLLSYDKLRLYLDDFSFTAPSFIIEIASVADWNEFCANVNGGHDYSGETVTMTANVGTVSTMCGTSSNTPFSGTFDGGGYTLTVGITGNSTQGQAPFQYISGATIENLIVTGSVTATSGSNPHASGLVGFAWSGTNTIDDCLVHTNVTNNGSNVNSHIGGIVGHTKSSTVVLNGCVYDGKLNSDNYKGGLIGWADNATVQLTNCLFNGTVSTTSNFHPIGCKDGSSTVSGTVTNCYYYATNSISSQTADDNNNSIVKSTTGKGKRAYSVTAQSPVSMNKAGSAIIYEVSQLTGYTTGIVYDANSTIYGGEGETLTLNLYNSPSNLYIADNGTLAGSTNPYTLTMTNNHTQISANVHPTYLFTNANSNKRWNDVGNWRYKEDQNITPSALPTNVDKVEIGATAWIPSGTVAEASEITINGGSLTILEGGQLKHYNTGVEATMLKSITGYGGLKDNYYLMALPFDSYTVAESPLDNSTYDLYKFDGSQSHQEWRNYENGQFTAITNGEGFLYAKIVTVDLPLTGELVPIPANGGQTFPLAPIASTDFGAWNLVGNPFACNVTSSISDYYVIGGNLRDEVVPSSGEIQPLQGIFVQATEQTNSVTFTPSNGAKQAQALNVNVTKANTRSAESATFDLARIRFGEGEGLEKFQLNPDHTKVYIPMEGKDYAVVYADAAGTMPVNFKAETDGTYTMNFNAEEVSFNYLHLIDNMTGEDVDLLAGASTLRGASGTAGSATYTFEAKTTDYESRFKLVFATGSSTGSETGNFAFFSNGSFVINNDGEATLQVFDMNGRILKSESINGCANVNVKAAAGVYVLRLVNGNDVKVQKVVVR